MRRRDFPATMAASSALSLGTTKSEIAANYDGRPRGQEVRAEAELFSQEELRPRGEYYEATVPDTLDLAERGRLAVRGLINFLDPERSYDVYQVGFFNTNPAYMSHYGATGPNWGKVTEGILMTRHMCGSTENLSQEETMFQKGILGLILENGDFAVDTANSLWAQGQKSDVFIPADTTRMYIALMVQNQLRPSAKLTQLIVRMAESVYQRAQFEDDYAYIAKIESDAGGSEGRIRISAQVEWLHGAALRGLCRTYAMTGDRKYLELGGKLKNLLLQLKHWEPEAAPKAITGGEHGEFDGHHHSYTSGLMGLIWYAGLTNDAHVKEFVRESYEYLRTFGIARIGMFGEMCTTGDMTYLAIKLSDLGVGDYWEDVDQYVRNQLVEQQVTDAERIHKVNASMPKLVEAENMDSPEYAKRGLTTDRVIDRFVGAWLSDASNPTLVRPRTFRWTVCCSGNCPPALYAAWEGTVRCNTGVAQVNLLLNRASPWLDMDSYLPYEGKVVIRNKAAKQLFVRIPRWVNKDKVRVEVNGKGGARNWVGRYLYVEGTRAGDQIRIDFPVVESKETYTLKWKAEDMWLERTDPGDNWKPHEVPDRFTFHLKGNTVVDVTPRTQGLGYPIYLRDYYQGTKTPMKQVMRYVSPVTVKW